jgi:hypothetical protein
VHGVHPPPVPHVLPQPGTTLLAADVTP